MPLSAMASSNADRFALPVNAFFQNAWQNLGMINFDENGDETMPPAPRKRDLLKVTLALLGAAAMIAVYAVVSGGWQL